MKKKGKFPIRYIPFVFLLITGGVVQGASLLDGGFTYQGQIKQNGVLVNGSCDFLFRLFDAQNDGSQVGANYPSNGVIVQNGLFSTTLNFGDVFKGNKTWLAIDVRCPSGRGSYTPLGPRQPLTATPYALSLRPSATIQGGIDSPAAVIKCINTSTGSGVWGEASNTGDYGGYFSGRTGVYVIGKGSELQEGYAGKFVSKKYRGIYALSEDGWYDAYFAGVGGIYSSGGIWSATAGRTVAANGGSEALEPGDVVALAGLSRPLLSGGEPILAVVKAGESSRHAVVGVVVQALQVQVLEPREGLAVPGSVDVQPVEGRIPPGGYLAIVTHGLAPGVKVSAMEAMGLRLGDRVSPAMSGQAKKTFRPVEANTILGQVAGHYDPATGTVPVFVNLK